MMGGHLGDAGSGFAERSRRGGIVRSALFLGIFLSALLTLGWMLALPAALRVKINSATGCLWEAERLACNPFAFDIRVENATLHNAPEFGDGRLLMRIRSFHAEGPFKSVYSGDIELDWVELDVERIVLVVDEWGDFNLSHFFEGLLGESRGIGDRLRIAHCRLKVETVEILDYSKPKPAHIALRLGIDVDGFSAEGAMGLLKPMMETLARSEHLPESISLRGDSRNLITNL